MMLFGRSRHLLEVLAADFMPFEKQLHIIVADADMNLQVLQFDPDSESCLPLSNALLPNPAPFSSNLRTNEDEQTPNQWAASVSSTNLPSIPATSP
jgi:hypothetical protein